MASGSPRKDQRVSITARGGAGMAENALAKKLKLKPGQRAAIVNAPDGYLKELSPLPDGVEMADKLSGKFDWVLRDFCEDQGRGRQARAASREGAQAREHAVDIISQRQLENSNQRKEHPPLV
jgi:hypothetical protein